MNADETIRFLEHEARSCRDRDECEAFCLLLPALLHAFNLPPMDDLEATAFKFRLKKELTHSADESAA
jgi:hypothetical protein